MKTTIRLRLSVRVAFALATAAMFSTAALSADVSSPTTDPVKAGSNPITALSPYIARPAALAPKLDPATAAAAKPAFKDTYFVSDYLGTTLASSDAAGEIAQIETDAFGAPIQPGAMPQDMRYTGKPYDEDMGAYIFPFRNYRPDEARWMTPDPSGFPDGVNCYSYAPVPGQGFDPLGLDSFTMSDSGTITGIEYLQNGGGITYGSSTMNLSNLIDSNPVRAKPEDVVQFSSSASPATNMWFVQEVQIEYHWMDFDGNPRSLLNHWLEGIPYANMASGTPKDTFGVEIRDYIGAPGYTGLHALESGLSQNILYGNIDADFMNDTGGNGWGIGKVPFVKGMWTYDLRTNSTPSWWATSLNSSSYALHTFRLYGDE